MIKDEVFKKCTRCGKEFTDLKVSVELGLYVERLRDTGVWEDVPNMTQESREFLCPDCFNKLCDILAKMNLPAATGNTINDNHVILPQEEAKPQPEESTCKCGAPEADKDNHTFHHSHGGSQTVVEEDMVEYVVSSKIMKNGVEIPGPDDGKVVRIPRSEWLARQAEESNKLRLESTKNDVAHHPEQDSLVDVCDDVIYG